MIGTRVRSLSRVGGRALGRDSTCLPCLPLSSSPPPLVFTYLQAPCCVLGDACVSVDASLAMMRNNHLGASLETPSRIAPRSSSCLVLFVPSLLPAPPCLYSCPLQTPRNHCVAPPPHSLPHRIASRVCEQRGAGRRVLPRGFHPASCPRAQAGPLPKPVLLDDVPRWYAPPCSCSLTVDGG